MSIVNDVVEKALEIKKRAPLAIVLLSALDAAEECGIDRVSAQTFLIGLQAIQEWYSATRILFKGYQYDAEFRRLSGGKVTTSYNVVAKKRDELNRFSKDELQVLLTLGFMVQCGTKTVSKKYINPLAPAISHIFDLGRDDELREDEAFRMYQNLSKRWNDLKKKHNDPNVALNDGAQLFQAINSTLYRLK